MIKYISSLLLSTLLIFLTATSPAQAFKPTNLSAVKVTPVTAMYTVSFAFGPSSYDYYVPIHTSRGVIDSDNLTLVYETWEDAKSYTDEGETAALVFSNSPIVNNTYFVEAGTKGEFTLVVFLRTQDETPEADYAVKVTKLPFTEDRGNDTIVKNGLTEPELSYYLTDEIELNE